MIGKRFALHLPALLIFLSSCTSSEALTATKTPFPTPTSTAVRTVGTDIRIDLPEGDPENGKLLARKYGCITCHVDSPRALVFGSTEELVAIVERSELRVSDPAYGGGATKGEEYVVESILLPAIYTVEGPWPENGMPENFGDLMTDQDLADIISWLHTFK